MEAQSESVYLNTAVWFAKHTGRMAPGPPSNCIDVQPARNDTAELNFYALRKQKNPRALALHAPQRKSRRRWGPQRTDTRGPRQGSTARSPSARRVSAHGAAADSSGLTRCHAPGSVSVELATWHGPRSLELEHLHGCVRDGEGNARGWLSQRHEDGRGELGSHLARAIGPRVHVGDLPHRVLRAGQRDQRGNQEQATSHATNAVDQPREKGFKGDAPPAPNPKKSLTSCWACHNWSTP